MSKVTRGKLAVRATWESMLQSPGPDVAGLTRLLTAAEVAEILRVPRSTVYELARNHRIPFLKVGRRTLFNPERLAQWIEAQNVPPRR
jgi:excisionase family DNA binding protein